MREMLKEVAKERLSRIGLKPDLSGELVDPKEIQKYALKLFIYFPTSSPILNHVTIP